MFYTFDPQGSMAQRLNSTGGIVTTDTGDAFGSRTTTGAGDVFGYVAQWGYYFDAETGLCLCQHRYYHPATGRFVTRDPTGYGGGINLYTYCQNNSANAADPSGFGGFNLTEAILSCISIIAGDFSGRDDPDFCADLGGCIGAAVVGAVEAGFPELAPIDGCLASLLGSLVASLVSKICDAKGNLACVTINLCDVVNIAIAAVASCLEGAIIVGFDILEVKELTIEFIDDALDVLISAFSAGGDVLCKLQG